MTTALNILVVDDATFIRDLVKKAVRAQYPDFNVEEATDGRHAQTLMTAKLYHVILCDWEMPEMSGLEVLEWMRQDQKYAKVPFMMITSRSEKSHIVKAVQAGVSDYIGKPFNNEQLGTKLARLIHKFYKMSPSQTARQAQQKAASADSTSLLTGGGGASPSASSKPVEGGANLLTAGAPSAQRVDKSVPFSKKVSAKKAASLALANVRLSSGETLRCIVKDINLNEMMVVVKREQGVPTLYDQVVVDLVSKAEDLVARVNCFVSMLAAPDKRIDGEFFNMMVRYDDVDPEKKEVLSKFVAKVR